MIPSKKIIQLRTIEIEKHSRFAVQIQESISALLSLADKLQIAISTEEGRARNYDPAHFAYPTVAKAAVQRRNNLLHTIDNLKIQLDDTKTALRKKHDDQMASIRLVERAQMYPQVGSSQGLQKTGLAP